MREILIFERNLLCQGRFANSLLIWKQQASRIAEERVAIETLPIRKLRNQLRFQGKLATMRRNTKSVP